MSEAQVSGTIRTATGAAVPRALVTLLDEAGTPIRTLDGGLNGSFVVRGLGPGIYGLRAEALGFSPKVYTAMRLRPGSSVRLAIVLLPAGGAVDTVAAAGLSQRASGGRWIDAPEFAGLPRPDPGLGRWAELSTLVGEGLGMEGLPGQFTRLSVDGMPFRPVRPLGERNLDRAGALLTGRTLSALAIVSDPIALGLRPGAGGQLEAFTRRGGAGTASFDAAGAAGGLRSASTDPDGAPGTTSVWAGGAASIVLTPDTAGLAIGADLWQIERPRAGLLPDGTGGIEGVGAPFVEQQRGFSGFARLDRILSAGGTFWGSGRLAIQPASSDLTAMAYGVGDTGERVDLLVGTGVMVPMGRRETLEARLGVTRSAWTAAADAGLDLPFSSGAPTALDATTGLRAGPGPLDMGTASRFDLDAGANVTLTRGAHLIDLGVQGGFASHAQDLGREVRTELLIGSGAPTSSWQGVYDARRFSGEVSATVPRLSAYAEDTWSAGPGLQIEAGVRFDSEWLQVSNVRPSVNWFQQAGLVAPALVDQVVGAGGFLGLQWQGGTGSQLELRGSYTTDEFDPLLMIEIMTSQEYGVFRGTGTFEAWPAVPAPAASPSAFLPGIAYMMSAPEAPATLRVGGAFQHTTPRGTEFSLAALARRTDGLTRRRDLNRPALARGQDAGGRDLWGQPLKIGAWIGGDPATLGRFAAWGPAWELDQGGWSEYVGVTGRIRHGMPGGVQFSAEYTWSRTEDNVPGIGGRGLLGGLGLEAAAGDDATVGVSDLDRPHRAVATVSLPVPLGEGSYLSGAYRFESGAPFTPGYAAGIDANMDGVRGNDPAFVSTATASSLGGDWSCLRSDAGRFATRNSCRGPDLHTLDLRLSLALSQVGVALFVDALNLLDQEISLLDTGLLRVDPAGAITGSGQNTTLPFTPNEAFGMPLRDLSPGRTLRVGVRIGR